MRCKESHKMINKIFNNYYTVNEDIESKQSDNIEIDWFKEMHQTLMPFDVYTASTNVHKFAL